MEKMVLAGYTFWRNPVNADIPKKFRSVATVQTYTDVAFFSWGTLISGQRINLEWDYITDTMFNNLQTLLEADAQCVWNPQNGSTYNVEIMKLDGNLFESSLLDADWRIDVKMELLIRSQV